MSVVGDKVALGVGDTTLKKFLDVLERLGVVSIAANAAGVGASTLYVRRGLDLAFAKKWAKAKAVADNEVSKELRRRAIGGIKETVYHQGKKCGTKVVHSDGLLSLLAKSAAPEYRDQSKIVVSTPDEERAEQDRLSGATEEQLRKLVESAEGVGADLDSTG